MGAGMSSELGARSLLNDNREELEVILSRLVNGDKTLTNVDLANRFIGDEGLIQHVGVLAGNSHIQRLDLSFNGLTAHSMPALMAAVRQCPNLLILDLAGNKIGEEGCRLLGDYLSTNPPLEELYVFHNDLRDKAVVPFANALLRNDTLAILNLDQNHLTNASWVMLHKAIVMGGNDATGNPTGNGNKGLVKLKVGTRADIVPSDAIVEDVSNALRNNKVAFDEKKAAQQRIESERRESEAAAARAKADQVRMEAEEAAHAEAEQEALYEQRRQEEEELRAYEAQAAAQQQRSVKKTKEQIAADNERWIARAMDQAYDWRKKLTQDGTLVKEWKDGFTTLTTQPGDEIGSKPTATIGQPRRLQACWCDPHDVSVPYAKTLHYHCKHEDLNKPLQDGQVPKYEGCCATGHVCSSVGFYSKPKPDKSAAHFFSSPQRAAREDGNDVYEDGDIVNVSHYSRSMMAASSGTAAPNAITQHKQEY